MQCIEKHSLITTLLFFICSVSKSTVSLRHSFSSYAVCRKGQSHSKPSLLDLQCLQISFCCKSQNRLMKISILITSINQSSSNLKSICPSKEKARQKIVILHQLGIILKYGDNLHIGGLSPF